jgi:hypothetical protein
MADNMIVTASAVPEPGGLTMLGIGALALLGWRLWIRTPVLPSAVSRVGYYSGLPSGGLRC